MSESHDVVIVGGGIAGSALATVLARDGRRVLVLERDLAYRDRIRGEILMPWGVTEMHQLGLEPVLRAAGGTYATSFVRYDETVRPAAAEATAVPLDKLLPGVAGALDVGHPEACAALAAAAAAAGATVRRGVRVIGIERGIVRYEHDGATREARCRLVVGADGRRSAVRRRLGIALHETTPRTACAGLLVDGLDDWPSDRIAIGTEGDLRFYLFPRAGGRVRLFLIQSADSRRFTGAQAVGEFLDAWRLDCIPGSAAIAAARPAGPCATYPLNDSWTDAPLAPGVVLIGDAAGWNDPIIGQGLAIALRDVRIVVEALRATDDPTAADFEPYAQERRERMRRLRLVADVYTDVNATFTLAGAARRKAVAEAMAADPLLAGPQLAVLLGPEKAPAESFTQANLDRMRAVA